MKSTFLNKIVAAVICMALLFANLICALPASAAESDPVYLLSGSDLRDAGNTQYLDNILNKVGQDYPAIDGLLFAGDYTSNTDLTKADSKVGINALKDSVCAVFPDLEVENMVLAQGEHDPYSLVKDGTLAPDGYNDTADYGVFVINNKCYGNAGTDPQPVEEIAAELGDYINAKVQAEYTKPIFVVSHMPLHYSAGTAENGDAMYGSTIFDVLNEAGAVGLNIIFVYGHNDSNSYDDFIGGGAVFLTKGDILPVAQASQSDYVNETLNFTYLNAGYTTYGEQTMVVYEITDDDVTFKRYYYNDEVSTSENVISLNKDIDTSITVADGDIHMQVDFLVREKLGYSFFAYGNDLKLYDNYDITLNYDRYYLAEAGTTIMRKVTEIEDGESYVIANRATGQVVTNAFTTNSSNKRVLVMGDEPSLETTDMWQLIATDSGAYYVVTTDGNNYKLKINKGNITFTSTATNNVEYHPETKAWTISTSTSAGATNYLQVKSDEPQYTYGFTSDLNDEYYLWDIYQIYTLENADYVKTNETVVFDANGTNVKVFEFDQVAAYEMMCNVTFSLNCYKQGVKAKTISATTTFANHLYNTIRATRHDKTAYVDMLNYGSAAQDYFANAKPKSSIASDTAAFGLPNTIEGLEKYQIYATSDEVASADLATTDAESATGSDARIGTALQILSSNRLVFMVDTGSYAASELTLRITYGDTVDETVVADLEMGGSYYYYYADEENAIALYDVKEVITAELLNGEDVVATKTYSVEAFVAESMMDDGKLEALGDALMKFADSVKKVVTGEGVYDDVALPNDEEPVTPADPEIDYVLKATDDIDAGKAYVIVNKATGTVWNTEYNSANYTFALDGTASVDTTSLWTFVDDNLAAVEEDGSYTGFYRPNGLLADGRIPIAKYSVAPITATYDEAEQAWTIGKTSDNGTYYFCADVEGNTVTSTAEITTPDEYCYWVIYEIVDANADESDDPNTGANFTFAFTTDIHVGQTGTNINNVKYMYQDLANMIAEGVELDALLISGDLTQNSYQDEWTTLLDCVLDYSPEGITTYTTLGNHDARSWDFDETARPKDVRWAEIWPRFTSFFSASTGINLEVPYYHVEIDGHNGTEYDLVVLCTETAEKDAAYLSPVQLEWFEETLNKIEAKKGEDHNILVMCHQPVNNTLFSNMAESHHIGEASADVKAIIADHPQVIYMSGHIHTSYVTGQIKDTGAGIYVDGIPMANQSYYRVVEIFDDYIRFRIRGIDGTWLNSYETIIVTNEETYVPNEDDNSGTEEGGNGGETVDPEVPGDNENTGNGDGGSNNEDTGSGDSGSDGKNTEDGDDNQEFIGELRAVTEVEDGKFYIFVNKGTGTVLTYDTIKTTIGGVSDQSVILLGDEPSIETETLFKLTASGDYYYIGDETVGFVKPNTISAELRTDSAAQAICLEYDIIDGNGWIIYRTGSSGDYVLQAVSNTGYTSASGLVTNLANMSDYCYWILYEII